MKLLNSEDLGYEFQYPKDFLKLNETGFIKIMPWELITDDRLLQRYNGLKKRFPDRKLIPFAQRRDCDEVACWDLNNNNKVTVIHDYSEPGWEQVAVFDSLWNWFRKVTEDIIEFANEDVE